MKIYTQIKSNTSAQKGIIWSYWIVFKASNLIRSLDSRLIVISAERKFMMDRLSVIAFIAIPTRTIVGSVCIEGKCFVWATSKSTTICKPFIENYLLIIIKILENQSFTSKLCKDHWIKALMINLFSKAIGQDISK